MTKDCLKMVNREGKHLIFLCQGKYPPKKGNILQHRRKQMIAEHGGFSAKILVPCWNLFQPINYSTYHYYHVC